MQAQALLQLVSVSLVVGQVLGSAAQLGPAAYPVAVAAIAIAAAIVVAVVAIAIAMAVVVAVVAIAMAVAVAEYSYCIPTILVASAVEGDTAESQRQVLSTWLPETIPKVHGQISGHLP